MARLHIINKSPFERVALHSCLQYAQAGDGLLLIEDAVVAVVAGTVHAAQLAQAMTDKAVYALSPDLAARGLLDKVIDGVILVDYAGFVDITVEYASTQSWL